MHKLKSLDLIQFLQQLRILLAAGNSAVSSLEMLGRHEMDGRFSKYLLSSVQRLRSGKSLHDALFSPDHPFPPGMEHAFRAMPDRDHQLEITIKGLEDNYRAQSRFIRTAAVPYADMGLTLFVFAALMLIFKYLVPMLAAMFTEMGGALPLPTRIVLAVSEMVNAYWYLITVFTALFLYVFFSKLAKSTMKRAELPYVFALIAGRMKSGADMAQALAWSAESVGHQGLRSVLQGILADVKAGTALSAALTKNARFLSYASKVVAFGEKIGDLQKAMEEIASFYYRKLDLYLKTRRALYSPCILILLGFVLGFVINAMYMPIFQIGAAAGK